MLLGQQLTPTGFGIPASIFLVSEGVTSVSFGISQILYGSVSESSQQTQDLAQKMPTGLLDTGGILVDAAMGNKDNQARTIAQGVSLVLSAGIGNSKLVTLPPSLNISTNIVTSIQAGAYVNDIIENNKNEIIIDNKNENKKTIDKLKDKEINYILRNEEINKSRDENTKLY